MWLWGKLALVDLVKARRACDESMPKVVPRVTQTGKATALSRQNLTHAL